MLEDLFREEKTNMKSIDLLKKMLDGKDYCEVEKKIQRAIIFQLLFGKIIHTIAIKTK